MTKINELAKEYVSPETHNIAELEKVSVEIDVVEAEYTKSDGEVFTVLETTINEVKYRVPVSVLKGLKTLIEARPNTLFFTVLKSGDGMKTSYSVIPAQ